MPQIALIAVLDKNDSPILMKNYLVDDRIYDPAMQESRQLLKTQMQLLVY
jgi:hypothetical protein